MLYPQIQNTQHANAKLDFNHTWSGIFSILVVACTSELRKKNLLLSLSCII